MGMSAKKLVLTRQLPKTGQIVSYWGGDDGTHQAGWWRGRLNANNKTRFIAKTIDGDDVVIDRATGLMWAADGNEAGCNNGNAITWSEAITWGNALDFAGSFKWRLPNIRELFSIMDYSKNAPTIDGTFFPNTQADDYWTSTTHSVSTTAAFYANFDVGAGSYALKTYTHLLRCVRGGL